MTSKQRAYLKSLASTDISIKYNEIATLKINLKMAIKWQGWKESNPPLEFWRLLFYR